VAWPDRLGIGVALLLPIGLALWTIEVSSEAGPQISRSGLWFASMFYMLPFAEVVIALPVWLIARILDFVAGGPQRRHLGKSKLPQREVL